MRIRGKLWHHGLWVVGLVAAVWGWRWYQVRLDAEEFAARKAVVVYGRSFFYFGLVVAGFGILLLRTAKRRGSQPPEPAADGPRRSASVDPPVTPPPL